MASLSPERIAEIREHVKQGAWASTVPAVLLEHVDALQAAYDDLFAQGSESLAGVYADIDALAAQVATLTAHIERWRAAHEAARACPELILSSGRTDKAAALMVEVGDADAALLQALADTEAAAREFVQRKEREAVEAFTEWLLARTWTWPKGVKFGCETWLAEREAGK